MSARRNPDEGADARGATLAWPEHTVTRAGGAGGTALPARARSSEARDQKALEVVLAACTCLEREGEAASEAFARQLLSLPAAEGAAVARLLVRAALGFEPRLAWYTRHAVELLAAASLDGAAGLLAPHLPLLEEAFNDPEARAAFLAAPDSKSAPRGGAFRRNWRFPLLLWVTLRQAGSVNAEETYRLLTGHARASQLRTALASYRRLLDGFSRPRA